MSHPSPVRPLGALARNAPFVSHDPEFEAVLGDAPRLVRVVETDAHEGPVYVSGEDALYFTTLPRRGSDGPVVAIKRVALDGLRFPIEPERVSVVRPNTGAANGMALDHVGALVVCEQGSHSAHARISRIDLACGSHETLAVEWRGRKLNSPNDVVVAGDGSIWFTDPSYGFLQGFRPEPEVGDHVYRFDPRLGRLEVVADTFDKPNGIAFSPDEQVLYVTDSGANQEEGSYYEERPHLVRAFDVVEGRYLVGERIFAHVSPGFPDGLKCDSDGRVYASCASGVQVFDENGLLLGEIALAGAVNFTFGGPERDVLFITTDDAIWAAVLDAKGA